MPSAAPMPAMPSAFVRARSSALRAFAARALPSSVLVTRGTRSTTPPRVALTFDDGPDRMTPRYVERLARLGVRATFFVVGEQAAAHGEALASYAREGHEVCGHGWSHEPFPSMSRERLSSELRRTQELLPRPRRRPMVRPPQGALGPGTLLRIAAEGYTTVLWSHDSDDCRECSSASVERALAPDRVQPGSIVLLHEGQAWTLEALDGAVGRLRDAGYELTTVSELLE
jgi:peptidoglycan-N-acetylglucosamine deacetylase